MVAPVRIGTSGGDGPISTTVSAAARLGPAQRRDLSLAVLAGHQTVPGVAGRHQVRRKFVYQQAAKAREALDEAFAPCDDHDNDDKVLFHLPVTRNWIRQLVLALVSIGHRSFRGVLEILDAVFDYRGISLGTIHHIVAQAVIEARALNDAQDLSNVRVGASGDTTNFPRRPNPCRSAPTSIRRIATCSVSKIIATRRPGACLCWTYSTRA